MAQGLSRHLPTSRDARLRRHNRALMDLTRLLWRNGHGLDHAMKAITETAADVLGVDRVNVWQFESSGGLRCVHGFHRGRRSHDDAGDEFIALDNDAYAAALLQARVIHVDDASDAAAAAPWAPIRDYVRRHGIQSLMDAPVRTSGDMYGVICHEQVEATREWRADEIAFAANMGDFVALAVEIERRKSAEAQIDFMRLHDQVSGLGNRTLFHGALQVLLQRLRWRPWLAAVLFMDIDRFHSINTSEGEAGGDAMLTTLGECISNIVPADAVVARVESDCFAVLLPRLEHPWQAARLADDIIASIGKLAHAHAHPHAHASALDIGASIGIAFTDGSEATTPEQLLRDADFASKQAKARGRNRYEIFDAEHHQSLAELMKLEYGLRNAFANGQLEVAYQPEMDAEQGVMVAAEALLRWRLDDGSQRTAADFIDVAETSGLIVPIGWWVLEHACQEAMNWPAPTDGTAPMLRVNLSARQFEQPDIAERIGTILRQSGLPPQRLCLELTETTLMTRAEAALDTLRTLRSLGVSLAIDDFGTGYSSMTYLKRFPVDTLKIDRSFVDGLPDNPFDAAIVESVIGLARTLGIDVVAEGVERIEQQHALQALGVRRMQGWLYAKAMDQASVCQWLSATR